MLTGAARHFKDASFRRQSLPESFDQRTTVAQGRRCGSTAVGGFVRLLNDVSCHDATMPAGTACVQPGRRRIDRRSPALHLNARMRVSGSGVFVTQFVGLFGREVDLKQRAIKPGLRRPVIFAGSAQPE